MRTRLDHRLVHRVHSHRLHRRGRVPNVLRDERVVLEPLPPFENARAVVVLDVVRERRQRARVLSKRANVRRDLTKRSLHRRGALAHELVADLIERDEALDRDLLRVERSKRVRARDRQEEARAPSAVVARGIKGRIGGARSLTCLRIRLRRSSTRPDARGDARGGGDRDARRRRGRHRPSSRVTTRAEER